MHADPELAVEVHTREELGVDPDNLPSPLVAAGSSFVSFAVGAALPVLPYLLGATTILPRSSSAWWHCSDAVRWCRA